jgi:hypothetical protein
LNVILANGYVPTVGSTYQILSCGPLTGTFNNGTHVIDALSASGTPSGMFFTESYAKYGGVTLQYDPNVVPGDINGDGLVDVADYNIWAANVGMTGASWWQGDLNGDGLVDVADYNIWAANVGKTSSTPEPATLSLLALGGIAMLRRRKLTV